MRTSSSLFPGSLLDTEPEIDMYYMSDDEMEGKSKAFARGPLMTRYLEARRKNMWVMVPFGVI
jgi:hypothetical protein